MYMWQRCPSALMISFMFPSPPRGVVNTGKRSPPAPEKKIRAVCPGGPFWWSLPAVRPVKKLFSLVSPRKRTRANGAVLLPRCARAPSPAEGCARPACACRGHAFAPSHTSSSWRERCAIGEARHITTLAQPSLVATQCCAHDGHRHVSMRASMRRATWNAFAPSHTSSSWRKKCVIGEARHITTLCWHK